MTTLESPIVAALNRLLEYEAWARERLRPFAGETVEFAFPPLPALRLAIQHDGRITPAERDTEPSLLVRLGPDAVSALLRGEEHFMRAVDVSGNAKLASEVLLLERNLRWDERGSRAGRRRCCCAPGCRLGAYVCRLAARRRAPPGR
jgi:ubiquinone biosynthesis protein UbiJ